MKLQNPILITLNNVPHIKADNLETVEVDSSCTSELETIISKYYRSRQGFRYSAMVRDLFEGLPISELLDRIEVREVTTHHKLDVVKTYKAFLLPEKEDECDGTCADNECICAEVRRQELKECLEIVDKKSYTIEEIEKAIEESNVIGDKQYLKSEIINNLKK